MVPTGWTRGLERFCSSPLSKETGPRVIDESNRGRRKQREHFLTILRADSIDDSNLKAARWCCGVEEVD